MSPIIDEKNISTVVEQPNLASQDAAILHQKSLPSTNSAVAVFHSHETAEEAIRDLQQRGFDMQRLSIVGKDYHTEEHVVGYYNTGDRMKHWGRHGAFWGALWGILFGSAFFVLPGVGPVLMAGPLVAVIVSALEGAAVLGGISALGGALASIGVPNDSIVQYEAELKIGKFLLIVHGTHEEVAHAKDYLDATASTTTMLHAVPVAISA